MQTRTPVLALCVLFLAGAIGLGGQQHVHERKEPNQGGAIDLASADPDEALERLRVADGYEVSLFASEREFPELANVLAMQFDARGRLWLLTSPTYPHYLPGTPPDDKLIILEDTDGDGRADDVRVFADGLYLPMGFELGDGGAYVSQQPNLMFLRDTTGDGRADERQIVLHGFGTEDSHHALHTFRWDPGGGLHFQEGTFHHTQVETPYGPVRVEEAAVFRYEPRTEKLSVFVSYPFANPWGHAIDRWGQNFISDASNGNNYYGTAFSGHVDYPDKQSPMEEWTRGVKVRPTANIAFVSSRHFPDEAQGDFLLTNVIGFLGIKQFRVSDEGSGFVAREREQPLLQSSDPNFRPIDLQFGPDGALYVVDWFNPLIGHMQYSLRDPRRDRTHGRVWRITAPGRPLVEPPAVEGRSIAAQLDLLKAPEDQTRYRVRRALREHPTEAVVDALETWVDGLDRGDAGYAHHLLEALWVHQHHDVVNEALLVRLLEAEDFRARAAAVRVLHHWFDRVDEAMPRLARMVDDPAPRVRLEAVRALSFVPTAAAAEAALAVLGHPMDYYLEYTLDATMRTLAKKVWSPRELLTAVERLDGQTSGDPGAGGRAAAALMKVLTASDRAALAEVRSTLERLARGGTDAAVRTAAFAALVMADGEVEPAWRQAVASGQRASAIAALAEVDGLDAEIFERLAALVADGADRDAAIAALAARRPSRWPAEGVASLAETLVAYVESVPVAERGSEPVGRAADLGRRLAERLSGAEGARIAAAFDALLVRTIRIEAVAAEMRFDVEHFTVRAGEEVEILLVNPDDQPHNLLVTSPGKLEDVGLQAEAMAAEPDAFERQFVPESPDVLFATDLINQGQTARLRFRAPETPDDYPFVCTFPGHWRTMNGTMQVVAGAPTQTSAAPGPVANAGPGPSSGGERPHIVFVAGDDEYRSEVTMPMIAAILEESHGMRTSVAYARPTPQTKDNIEGLEALDDADLMVMYTRFRSLPEDQLQRILDFTRSGKPMIGLRTTTHAFQYPDGHPRQPLNDDFGREVFGQKWITHHGSQSSTEVAIHDANSTHPVLEGVEPFRARSWLYHVAPLHGDRNTVLLDGTSVDSNKEDAQDEFPLTQPVAWTRDYEGARVFFTTLGHPEDFEHESMRRLLVNAIYWALEREVPPGGTDATGGVPYTAPETFRLGAAPASYEKRKNRGSSHPGGLGDEKTLALPGTVAGRSGRTLALAGR